MGFGWGGAGFIIPIAAHFIDAIIWGELDDAERSGVREAIADPVADEDVRSEAAMRRREKLQAVGSEAFFFSGLARIDGEFRSICVAVTPHDFVLLDNWAHAAEAARDERRAPPGFVPLPVRRARPRVPRWLSPLHQPGPLTPGLPRLRRHLRTLGHHGVLFLDEFTEFRRDAVEGLRQPMEDGRVVVTRMVGTVEFPSRFTLVAAANPCPCGFHGDAVRQCICRGDRLETYAAKLAGPLLDRVDLRLIVPRLTRQELMSEGAGESSKRVRGRVEAARSRQRRRYAELGFTCNAHVPGPVARREVRLSAEARALLASAVELHALTGRGFDRALKVGRTIADLDGSDLIEPSHVVEALAYRSTAPLPELERAG
jgi:MoxR-like ATPase